MHGVHAYRPVLLLPMHSPAINQPRWLSMVRRSPLAMHAVHAFRSAGSPELLRAATA